MKKITDYISKEVVTIAEGMVAGIVSNACVGEKLTRVRGWKITSDDKDETGFVPLRRILGDMDAIILPRQNSIQPNPTFACPLGAEIFDSKGRFLGILRDLVFDEETGLTHSLLADEKEFSPKLVVSAGKQAIIFRAEEHAEKTFRLRAAEKDGYALKKHRDRAEKQKNQSGISSALDLGFSPVETESTQTSFGASAVSFESPIQKAMTQSIDEEGMDVSKAETNATEDAAIPLYSENENSDSSDQNDNSFSFGAYGFLLGRTLTKNLIHERVVLAPKGCVVDAEILNKARAFGKLVELTVNSKRA